MCQEVIKRYYDSTASNDAEVSRNVVRAVVGKQGYFFTRLHAMANEKGSICVRSLVYALAGIFFTLKLYKGPVRGLCSAFMQRMIKRKDVLQHAD
jgi:hypothetical protein